MKDIVHTYYNIYFLDYRELEFEAKNTNFNVLTNNPAYWRN